MIEKKLNKMARELNRDFAMIMDAFCGKELGVDTETSFAFLVDRLITTRKDGKDLEIKQLNAIKAFSEGYCAAMTMVRDAAKK